MQKVEKLLHFAAQDRHSSPEQAGKQSASAHNGEFRMSRNPRGKTHLFGRDLISYRSDGNTARRSPTRRGSLASIPVRA
jgi:hypothetical protein